MMLATVAVVWAMLASAWWVALLLAPVAALFASGAATIGHEGGHRSFAATPLGNELVLHLAFPLWGGLGTQHWKNKHNRGHHGFPNVEGVDDDISLWPMATSSHGYAASARPRRWFQRHLQGWAFWPLTFLFLTAAMRLQSIRYLIVQIRKGKTNRAVVLDGLCLLGHYAFWIGLAGWVFGFAQALLVYALLWAWVGLYLGMIFAPAHMGLPIHADKSHGWEHQIETTRNLRMPSWMAFFVCGLDYQVEHHLFPKIPHLNLPTAAAITRAWCAEHGLRHQTIGFGAALADVSRFMAASWRIAPVASH